jgi:hypothetical protein
LEQALHPDPELYFPELHLAGGTVPPPLFGGRAFGLFGCFAFDFLIAFFFGSFG